MKKSQITKMPDYYDRYIKLAKDIELIDAFDDSINDLNALDRNLIKKLDGKTYAENKWTVKEILQHLIDTERIFNYRALLFARDNGASAPGFDQDEYVKRSNANKRDAEKLIDELIALRVASKYLFDSFDEETLLLEGKSWDYEVSILALGFTTIGHQTHHLDFIKEKYFPLIG